MFNIYCQPYINLLFTQHAAFCMHIEHLHVIGVLSVQKEAATDWTKAYCSYGNHIEHFIPYRSPHIQYPTHSDKTASLVYK